VAFATLWKVKKKPPASANKIPFINATHLSSVYFIWVVRSGKGHMSHYMLAIKARSFFKKQRLFHDIVHQIPY
jgi:hypothetical protein